MSSTTADAASVASSRIMSARSPAAMPHHTSHIHPNQPILEIILMRATPWSDGHVSLPVYAPIRPVSLAWPARIAAMPCPALSAGRLAVFPVLAAVLRRQLLALPAGAALPACAPGTPAFCAGHPPAARPCSPSTHRRAGTAHIRGCLAVRPRPRLGGRRRHVRTTRKIFLLLLVHRAGHLVADFQDGPAIIGGQERDVFRADRHRLAARGERPVHDHEFEQFAACAAGLDLQ